jgi:hypothetical protein
MRGTIAWSVREAGALEGLAPSAPAPGGAGCCRICRGWAGPRFEVCFSCSVTLRRVSHPCERVAVMSLCRAGSPLHELLRDYKDGRPRTRDVLSARVAALTGAFLWREGPVMAPEGWDAIVAVPSTAGRPGPHPLEGALDRVDWLAGQVAGGGVTYAGPGQCGHRRAEEAGFRVDPALAGARVLVVDDTWASGARVQSTASALVLAGAAVAAVAVLGRYVTPMAGTGTEAWWKEQVRAGRAGGLAEPARAPVRRRATARRS